MQYHTTTSLGRNHTTKHFILPLLRNIRKLVGKNLICCTRHNMWFVFGYNHFLLFKKCEPSQHYARTHAHACAHVAKHYLNLFPTALRTRSHKKRNRSFLRNGLHKYNLMTSTIKLMQRLRFAHICAMYVWSWSSIWAMSASTHEAGVHPSMHQITDWLDFVCDVFATYRMKTV